MIAHDKIKGIPSSKLYEYIALQKPILLCPSDHDIIDQTVSDVQLGLFADDADQCYLILKQSYDRYLNNLPLLTNNLDRRRIDKYSRKNSSKRLAEVLNYLEFPAEIISPPAYKMKALILCSDFPPLNSIGAQRPYSWYRYFKKFGIDVTVITKNWSGNSATIENVLSKSPINEVSYETSEYGKIIRVPHIQTLVDCLFLKYGDRKFVLVRKFLSFLFKSLSFTCFFFDKHRNIYYEAKKYLRKNHVNYIITTGEPFILFKYGYLLKKEFHFQWVADYRDGWYLDHNVVFGNIFNRFNRTFEFYYERKYINRSDLIQTVDPVLAGKLSALFKQEVKVVYNGFDTFYSKTRKTPTCLPLTFTHTGTLFKGQRIEFLLDVLYELDSENLISSSDIKFNFIGIKFNMASIERISKYKHLLNKYFYCTERIDRNESIKICAESDYLLNFTQRDYSILYAKTYDYLSVKRPILVIPGDNGLLSDLILKNNIGHVFYSASLLKQFIIDNLKLKKEGKSIPDISYDESAISFYTREKQTEIFCKYLLRDKNIMILAHDFAPLNTIGAQRPYSWYLYFKLFGLHPNIVTRQWDGTTSLNQNYFRKSESSFVQSYDTKMGTIIKAPYKPNLRDTIIYKYGVNKFVWLRKLLTLINNILQLYTLIFDNKSGIYRAAKKQIETKHFDFIIATGEPFILFRYAYKLNKRYKIPWIADYRDGWTTNYDVLYNVDHFNKFLINYYFRRFEKKYVKTSKFITTTADPIRTDLTHLHPGKNIEIIYNGYFEELFEELDSIEQNSQTLEIAYCGTIYSFQKLEMFLGGFASFIKDKPESKITISFYGIDFKTLESMRVLSFDAGINKFIQIVNTLPQRELLIKLKKANVLLLLGNKYYPQIYAKIFEYLAMNRKIMLVENDHSEMSKILKETNSGLICENENQVATHLSNLYNQFVDKGGIYNETKHYFRFRRQYQAERLARIINAY
jgi:hypothetical protein